VATGEARKDQDSMNFGQNTAIAATAQDLAAEINAEHVHAQRDATNAIVHAVRCGELLLSVKVSLKHGEFLPWVEQNCEFTHRTATAYMRGARQIGSGFPISSLSSLFGPLHEKVAPVDDADHDVQQPGGDDVRQADHRAQGDVDHDDDDVQLDHVDEAEPEPRRTKRQSRAQRWGDAVEQAIAALDDLIAIQSEYREWRDGLPENLSGSSVAEKLDVVTQIDLTAALDIVSEAEGADLPLGFGRD
jgi:hypothetical protein